MSWLWLWVWKLVERRNSRDWGGATGCLALELLGKRESRPGKKDIGRERRKREIKITETIEGNCSTVSPLPLGRRMSQERSQASCAQESVGSCERRLPFSRSGAGPGTLHFQRSLLSDAYAAAGPWTSLWADGVHWDPLGRGWLKPPGILLPYLWHSDPWSPTPVIATMAPVTGQFCTYWSLGERHGNHGTTWARESEQTGSWKAGRLSYPNDRRKRRTRRQSLLTHSSQGD